MELANKKTRTEKSAYNMITGLVYRLIMMFFPFLIKTITIYVLGAEFLGLNSLFTSILQVLSLSELGVGSAMVYNMYKPVAEHDKQTVCALLNLYRKIYRGIGSFILLVGIVIMPFLDKLIASDYPENINIYILYIIYLGNTVITYFLFAYKKSLLEAHQINGIENKINSIVNVIMYTGQIIVLLLFKSYYVYIILLPLSTIAINIVRNITVDKMFPEYECSGKLDSSVVNDIKKKVFALVGHKIGTTIITSADSIIISAYLGLIVLAKYGNYYYIINSLIGFVTVFYTSILASVGNSIIKDDKDKIYSDFKRITFMNVWIVSWCSVCLACLYQPFMRIWMGEEMMFDYHIVVLLVVYFYSWLFRRIGLTYKDAAGMWNEDFWKPYVGAVVNLVANIMLVNIIGIEGVMISTIIVMLIIYFPWETYILFKKLFKRSAAEYIMTMVMYTIAVVGITTVTYFICSKVNGVGIVALIIRGAICVCIPNILFLLIYRKEMAFVKTKIMQIIKK